MKRLCFGTLIKILHQAGNPRVTIKDICGGIFTAYGYNIDNFDSTLPSHLKSGHDNVPKDITQSTRISSFDDMVAAFQKYVIVLIKADKYKSVVRTIKDVLVNDTTISDNTNIGYNIGGYEKHNIVNTNTFNFASILAAVFWYAICNVDNKACQSEIKAIDKNYVAGFDNSPDPIYFESTTAEIKIPLKKTLNSGNFSMVFKKVSAATLSGLSNPSTVQIYGTDIANCKFNFRSLKQYLLENISNYVSSRATVNTYAELDNLPAVGTQATIKLYNYFGENAGSVLSEMLLYVFLEQELNAPKIMSKLEISTQNGNYISKSDGIHLLATTMNGQPFHQLVFGASDIMGGLQNAVDRAFDKIISISTNNDNELNFVDNTIHQNIFDKETTNYMVDLLLPKKNTASKPDMAFGIFLGYTMDLGYVETNNTQYRIAVHNKMASDIDAIQGYILKKIADNGLAGYSFYFYVIPFNDAPTEKESIISEMLRGG